MNKEILHQELSYRTSRSGGKGGQNVNKVETKAEALFNVRASRALDDAEKSLILERLSGYLTSEGILAVVNQTERSQLMNKIIAAEKLQRLLEKALQKVKPRKKTAIPRVIVVNRLKSKKIAGAIKSARRSRRPEEWLEDE
ncbi:MAG: aminoacyl-tRNA hydrolase [Bacteroidota bacterium]|jgi:ribosome-associated protein|nr:aminoacyl-tRNA hydrolase [Saprospiraceae bacterium]